MRFIASLIILIFLYLIFIGGGSIPALEMTVKTRWELVTDDPAASRFTGPSIVMEDAIMLHTSTGDTSEVIDLIEIFSRSGNKVKTIVGCGSNTCRDSLTDLIPDAYEAVVTTDLQNTFNDFITVGE